MVFSESIYIDAAPLNPPNHPNVGIIYIYGIDGVSGTWGMGRSTWSPGQPDQSTM